MNIVVEEEDNSDTVEIERWSSASIVMGIGTTQLSVTSHDERRKHTTKYIFHK